MQGQFENVHIIKWFYLALRIDKIKSYKFFTFN